MKLLISMFLMIVMVSCVEEIPVEELEEEVFSENPVTQVPTPIPIDHTPPIIYSQRYIGTLNASSTSIIVSLKTTESASCKYDFQDKNYQSLQYFFDATNSGIDHSKTISLAQNPKEVFIRCADEKLNENTISKIVDLTKPAAPPVELNGFAHFSNFVTTQCMNCHQPGGRASSWDFSPYQTEDDWKNSDLIEVGNALKSKIYYRLKGSEGTDGQKNMPTDKDIENTDVVKIKTWIDSLKIDPVAPPVISFVKANSMINEDGGAQNIKIKLSKVSSQTVTVNLNAISGTAMAGSDFTISNNIISFASGELEKTAIVNIVESDPSESNEAVIFGLNNPSGATLAGITNHTLSIIEIDKLKPSFIGLDTMVELTAGELAREINFMTSEAASCSFARSANVPIASMTALTTTGGVNQRGTIDQLSQTADTLIYFKCIDGAQNTSDEVIVTFISEKPFAPYGGTPSLIPGRIEAEAFDTGDNGVAYLDNNAQTGVNFRSEDVDIQPTTDSAGGDYNIGWTQAGEWFQYTVNIAEAGLYQIIARTATNYAGPSTFSMSINGQNIANFSTGTTGGWQSFQNLNADNIALKAGIQTIRVTQNTGGVNLNFFNFIKTQDLVPPRIASFNCSEPLKVNELFMCRVKLEGEGATLEYNSNCDWLRIGGGGSDYVAVGTPRQFSNNCRLTLKATRFGLSSQEIVRELNIDKSNDGVEVCDTPEIVSYNTHIKPLIENNCMSCHDDSNEDGGISYEYIHKNNYTTFDASSETQVIWAKTIDQIRWSSNGNPPKMPISLANGRRHLTKCEVKIVEKFMGIEDSNNGLACNTVASDPGEFIMHRLNNLEYRNTLNSLMLDNSFNLDIELPEESPGAMGFTTMALSQFPDLMHSNVWWEAAEKFAEHYVENKANVTSCNDDNCAQSIIRNFAIQAFRRNSIDDTYYNNLISSDSPYSSGKQEGGVKLGIQSALQAVLMSPQFLMHYHERNSDGITALNPQELANRISYTLWQSPPDSALRAKANDSSILANSTISAEVSRMLADNRSANFSNTFVFDWMGLNSLSVKKEELADRGYPGVNVDSLIDSSVEETKRFFSHIVQNNRNVNELITANYTFANQELAQFYNIQGPQDNGFTQVNSGDRRGILTHASVLAAHSKADATSPTSRGEFIMNKILCDEVGSPPAGVDAEVEDAAGISRTVSNVYDFVLMANTEKIGIDANKQIVGDTACIGCHSVTDPLGVTLESYDVLGKDRQTYSDNVPVRTHSMYNGTRLNNSTDMVNYINQTQKFKACLTKNLYHYSIRRGTAGLADSCEVQDIASGNGNDPASILEQIFTSDSFKRTRGER